LGPEAIVRVAFSWDEQIDFTQVVIHLFIMLHEDAAGEGEPRQRQQRAKACSAEGNMRPGMGMALPLPYKNDASGTSGTT